MVAQREAALAVIGCILGDVVTQPASEKLRAWWAHQQGLDATMAGTPVAEVLSRTGWARSVGGSAPYLTLFARAGLSRDVVDAAVAAQEVSELPSARGCTYLLPSADFAVGLTVGAGAPEAELTAAVKHLDVTRGEIEKLGEAVLAALGTTAQPLDPAAIKREVGDAVRSLGEAGKKRGISTTLPLTLGLLQSRGEIRKVPVHGRLDEQRFGYVAWTPSPVGMPLDPDVARTELARRYFRWAGPATLKHFRWCPGCSTRPMRPDLSRHPDAGGLSGTSPTHRASSSWIEAGSSVCGSTTQPTARSCTSSSSLPTTRYAHPWRGPRSSSRSSWVMCVG